MPHPDEREQARTRHEQLLGAVGAQAEREAKRRAEEPASLAAALKPAEQLPRPR